MMAEANYSYRTAGNVIPCTDTRKGTSSMIGGCCSYIVRSIMMETFTLIALASFNFP